METVYKSGGEDNDYLITLEINPDDTNTNLSRGFDNFLATNDLGKLSQHVNNKLTAKYRGRKAFVKAIEHKETGVHVDSVNSSYSSEFIYRVGTWVEDTTYGKRLKDVCSPGIHFYNTVEPALYWRWHPKNGHFKRWYDNGALDMECEYKDSKRNGPYKQWHKNGQLWVECEYKNGKIEGLYRKWYTNNQLCVECTYKDNKRDGPYKQWREYGQLWAECEYKDGKLDGVYNEDLLVDHIIATW